MANNITIVKCFAKKEFYTLVDVKKKADKYNLRYYKCPICNFFHLTNKEQYSPKKINRDEIILLLNYCLENLEASQDPNLLRLTTVLKREADFILKNLDY